MALLSAAALCAGMAHGQDIEAAVATSYLDTDTFIDRFSDKPVAQLTGTFDIGPNGYVEAYAYSGFEDLFADASSEYGLELGGEWDAGGGATVNLAAGRWANYSGAGFDAGDWFARAAIGYSGADVSVSFLEGDSDTAIVNASYGIEVEPNLTLLPAAGYITATGAFNLGVTAEYRLDRFALSASLVAPENDAGGRSLCGAVSLAWRMGR